MSATLRENRSSKFFAVAVAGLALWIVVTDKFMSHAANLWFVIPAVTIILACFVPRAPRTTVLTSLGLQVLNVCFFNFAEPWDEVSLSGGWTLLVVAIAANAALAGTIAWRMRLSRTTIADGPAGRQSVVLKVLSVTCWLAGTLVSLFIWLEPPSHDADIYYLLILGTFLTAGYSLYRSRQYKALARRTTVESDRRPAVLYLRSFSRDESAWQASLSFLFNPQFLPRGRREEEQLAHAVSPIGRLLAVGKPGEALPAPGAHRTYVGDAEWKSKVASLMQEAQLVIVRVETGGEGLWWEIVRAFETVAPGRLLLLFTLSGTARQKALKEIANRAGLEALRGVDPAKHAFLWRRPDGGTEVLNLKAPYWRTSTSKWLASQARWALRPVFGFLSVEWTAPPISLGRVAVTIPGVVVILFVLSFLIL
ncbi:MAG TPA: hypothetical protein VKE51_01295 [Vicinamibacterales bacterium]|nr:hypothetical protein [Vicinamibacterales bacterium]